MNEFVIEAAGLTRYYGDKAAVDRVDLRVPKGSVCGLVGRNGSGKTTLIKMLLGLVRPTRGKATVLGRDSRDIDPTTRARIGYLPETHPLYEWMAVGEAGRFFASFYPGQWNAGVFGGLVEYFELDPKAKIKRLSRGQKAQVALALVLAQEPELLVMDDPTLGLDAVVRREFVESIVELIQEGGRTVLLSTHVLSDVERVADRVVVLDRGRVRADCSVDSFREKVKRVHLTFAGTPPELPEMPGVVRAAVGEREITVTVAPFDEAALEKLKGLAPESVEVVDLGIEDAFVDYTSPAKQRRMADALLRGRGESGPVEG